MIFFYKQVCYFGTLVTADENVKWDSNYRKQYGGSSKTWKQNHYITQQFHCVYVPKQIENKMSKNNVYTHIHSFIHSNKHVEATQMGIKRCMDKQNVGCIYETRDYQPSFKGKEILTPASTISLQDLMLNEISHSQKKKDQQYLILLIQAPLEQSDSQKQKVEGWLPETGEKEE